MHVMQEAHSVSRGMTVTLGGAVVRNDVSAMMTESASEANMLGVYCITGETLADNHTVMDHRVAHCLSNELFKGIVSGNARGVFNGKIFVRQDAQKTLAYQSNRNIVLSETASVNTKPQLEIFADDVKCSHGCTVGTIDEEAMFYAQSRGIGKEEARALLLAA
ncbi:MAG: SufB/SufD family protein, partial [Candidatus Kapaibacterium sp.]